VVRYNGHAVSAAAPTATHDTHKRACLLRFVCAAGGLQARDALQSLAEAEGRTARPATAHPPTHTPGGRALPHYMAPTSTALRKQQVAAGGAGSGAAAGARVIGGPTQLKSKVVPSDTYDPT
jgi:hypothetical protein